MDKHITIIGAGNGGFAAAADLQYRGFQITLYDLPEYQHNLYPVIETGRIKFTGEQSVVVPIHNVAVDIEQAMAHSDVVLIITHAGSHETIANLISPYIRDDQMIIILSGYTGSALCFAKQFRNNGVNKRYLLGESNTLPYACRKIAGESAVHLKLHVGKFSIAAFPSKDTPVLLERFRSLYPRAVAANDVLETGFNNGSPVLNVVTSVFNAGRIEFTGLEFNHFHEGVTPSVAKVMEKLDLERMAIARAYEIGATPYLERAIETGYITTKASWYQAISTSPHLTAKGPDTLNTRYLTEDVPFGLVPWQHLAAQRQVESKLLPSFICLASALMGQDYLASGRNLADMGIAGMSNEELTRYLQSG